MLRQAALASTVVARPPPAGLHVRFMPLMEGQAAPEAPSAPDGVVKVGRQVLQQANGAQRSDCAAQRVPCAAGAHAQVRRVGMT